MAISFISGNVLRHADKHGINNWKESNFLETVNSFSGRTLDFHTLKLQYEKAH